MKTLLTLALATALGIGAPAIAQDAAPLGYDVPTGVVALSPEAREATLSAAAQQEHDLSINGGPGRKIHGEIGMEMGSRGYHALYGTAVVPLGQNATASFSFLTAGMNGFRR